MADTEFDPFNTDDSNDIGEYQGVVKTSSFEVNDDYDAETLILQWELEITGPEDFPFPTRQISFTAGKKFESPDGGKTAVHESGKPKGFNSTSRIGMLIHRAFHDPDSDRPAPTLGGEKDGVVIASFGLREHFTQGGFTPFDAEAWIGLTFDFHQETRDYGGEIGPRSFEMPIALVATEKEETKPATKKAAPATKKPGTRKRAAKKADVAEAPDWEKVKELILDAGEDADDHDALIAIGATVLKDNGIDENTDGVDAILAWLDDEEDGAWAEYE